MPIVKHRYTWGYLWVSNQFTSSWVGNTRCLRKFPTRLGSEPWTSGFIVKYFTTTLPHHPGKLTKLIQNIIMKRPDFDHCHVSWQPQWFFSSSDIYYPLQTTEIWTARKWKPLQTKDYNVNDDFCLWACRKHSWKRRKCWSKNLPFRDFNPLPHNPDF